MKAKIVIHNLLTFIVGPLIAIPFLAFLKMISVEEILSLFISPVFIAFLLLSILTFFTIRIAVNRKVETWLRERNDAGVEAAQKALILYQKLSIYLPIVYSLGFGLALPHTSSILSPGEPAGFWFLCLCLTFLLSLFFYIRYLQVLEQYTWDLPYSPIHRSMPFLTRNLLVVVFTTVGSLGLVIMTFLNAEAALWIVLPTAIFALLFVVIDNVLLAVGVNGRLTAVNTLTQRLSEGDLTGEELPTMSRDEFGDLIHNSNRTQRYLSQLAGSLKEAVIETHRTESAITTTSKETGDALKMIRGGNKEVGQSVSEVGKQVDGAQSLLSALSDNIKSVVDSVDAQAAMSEESTAALTEMAASVKTINGVAQDRLESADRLKDQVNDGGENLERTVEAVQTLHSGIQTINEFTELIAAVAGQTNLLAMNAAIEAAHAGEAGRGFAVVADEIRKLAVDTDENSRQINDAVTGMIESIENAFTLGAATSRIFENMGEEIRRLVESLKEIETGVSELGVGAGEVLASVVELSEHSNGLRTSAGHMRSETDGVSAAMTNLVESTSDAQTAVTAIQEATETAVSTEVRLAEQVDKLRDAAGTLEQRVNRFKT